MITANVAYNIRFKRGLALPLDKQYKDNRLLEIANEQHALLSRLAELDNKIKQIFEEEMNNAVPM